jgi:hypothetical protein
VDDLDRLIIQAQRAEEYHRFLMEEFVDVMRKRGHEIKLFNDEILIEDV